MENIEEKEILIKDLPESYEKESLSRLCIDPATSHVHAVAKRGGLGTDWAAYIGWPDFEHLTEDTSTSHRYYAINQHHPSDVLANGDKLSEAAAALIFPDWAAAFMYRR